VLFRYLFDLYTTVMATTKVILSTRIDREAIKEFDTLAKTAGLDRSGYLQLWISTIRRLKREYAVTAVSSIPTEMLKGFPGRPTDEAAGKVT